MTFNLNKASNLDFEEVITISSLEDLQALEEKYNSTLIIDFFRHEIWIYDDYME